MSDNMEERENVVIDDETLLLVRGNIEDRDERKEYIKKLANAIVKCFDRHGKAKLRYVGAGAGNNADKALIIAYDKAIEYEYVLAYMPDFTTVKFKDKEKTGIIKEVVNVIDMFPQGFNHEVEDQTLLLVRGTKKDRQENSEYVKKLANAILQVYYKHKKVNLRYVGAGAGNNADKALIIARGGAFKNGDILASVPAFTTVEFDGNKTTGIIKGIINIRELY